MATRTRKILLGCGVGCLGAIALSIGACVGFSVWLKQPGQLLEPTRLLGRGTTGYVEWSLRAEDPGSEALVESLIELSERTQNGASGRGPAWLDQLMRTRRRQNNAQTFRALIPSVVAWTLRPGDGDGADVHLFSASIQSLGNRTRMMDMALRYTLGLKHSVKHAGERIYLTDEGAMFIRDNTFFITDSETSARWVVDRLAGEAPERDRDPTALEQHLGSLPDDSPLRGAVDNGRGELWRIWRTIAGLKPEATPPEMWSAIRAATMTGGFTDRTAFVGTLDLQGPDALWAQANAGEFLELLRSGYGRGHLPVELGAEPVGNGIRISFRIDDVFTFLEEL